MEQRFHENYGEIDRANSTGPDISRYKFTGQEEDKEVGLMYYKARYYDQMLGRFTSADSVISPNATYGLNRFMYVEGNPVMFRDPEGHKSIGEVVGETLRRILTPPEIDLEQFFKSATNLNDLERIRKGEFALTSEGFKINREKLKNHIYMAAVGYAINGEEGAAWGFVYGYRKNENIERRRAQARFRNYRRGLTVLLVISGYGIGEAIGMLITEAFAAGTAAGVVGELLNEVFDPLAEQWARYEKDSSKGSGQLERYCLASFVNHSQGRTDSINDIICLSANPALIPKL